MRRRALRVLLGVGLAWALPVQVKAVQAVQAEPESPPPAAEPAPEPAPAAEATPPPAQPQQDAAPAPEPPGRALLERVLPCGTRVMVARDDSLPVASVVLALELGSEDDPPELPGLHHALAYQLLMGNRNTAPGGIQAMVQDAGGIAFLSTGPAQVRYESLVPVTVLDELIVAEAQRLRAPTVTQSLWKEALVSAKRDKPLRRGTAWQATAVAHGSAGLGHPPRMVSDALRDLDVATVQAELARRARYDLATLVVVAPLPIEDTFAKVEAALADLPARPRTAPQRRPSPTGTEVELAKAPGKTFVWALPADPQARLWADAWCEAISRQRRSKGEPKPNQLRCAFDDDPRRPTLSVRVRTPDDARTLLEERFARLESAGDKLLRGPRRRLTRALAAENATPLGLARRLAAAPDLPQPPATLETRTGQRGLEGPPPPLSSLLPLQQAVRIVPPRTPGPNPEPNPVPEKATP